MYANNLPLSIPYPNFVKTKFIELKRRSSSRILLLRLFRFVLQYQAVNEKLCTRFPLVPRFHLYVFFSIRIPVLQDDQKNAALVPEESVQRQFAVRPPAPLSLPAGPCLPR